MKVAIIGCGNIAQVHAWSLRKLGNVEMVAFVDCDMKKAEKMSDEYTEGKAHVFKDYLVMFDQIKPDVVHICTPHFLHVPMAVEALKRNISVFMEKPPAITKEEFDTLCHMAKQSKGKVGFCFQNRYNRSTVELDRIVASNELGEVLGVRGIVTWRRDENYYADEWHGKLSKEGGGVLMNQSIHTLDLMLRYLGEPIRVEAFMQNHHLKGVTEVEDTMEAWMEFEGGKRASFFATTAYATDAPVILELSFEKGRVTLIDSILQIHTAGGETKSVSCEWTDAGIGKSYWGRGHLACIKDYYECLESGIAYSNDISGVENTLNTTMKIYEEARKN